jgi:N-acetylmuramoyl-L-alanine amidase
MNILQIQEALKKLGFNPGVIDGKAGKITKKAVEAFQEKYGLVVDGKAGPQTKKVLLEAITPPKSKKPEPDKTPMQNPAPELVFTSSEGLPPPNLSSLKLLDTKRPIDEIINHCTATPAGKDYTVEDVRSWHKARGFSDVGYHYLIHPDGRISLGRPIGQVGAHVQDHNTGTIGVSYFGGISADGKRAEDTRTEAQRSSMLWLNRFLAKKFKVKKITGHNQYANKACPSFDVRKDPLGAIV